MEEMERVIPIQEVLEELLSQKLFFVHSPAMTALWDSYVVNVYKLSGKYAYFCVYLDYSLK